MFGYPCRVSNGHQRPFYPDKPGTRCPRCARHEITALPLIVDSELEWFRCGTCGHLWSLRRDREEGDRGEKPPQPPDAPEDEGSGD
jgi:hypothetical protein